MAVWSGGIYKEESGGKMRRLDSFFAELKAKWERKRQEAVAFPLPVPPLLLVPGTGGTADRFDKLIRLLKKQRPDLSVLKITVNVDHQLRISGRLFASSRFPVVVIAFADASEAALLQQADWLRTALMFLEEYYQVAEYDYFGHSNGGLVITEYLENQRLSIDPRLQRLLLTGTPFGGAADANDKSIPQYLSSYRDKRHRIPEEIAVTLIAGNLQDSFSDGIVPVNSVATGLQIYKGTRSSRLITVTEGAAHSQLVTHPIVIELLLGEFGPKTE